MDYEIAERIAIRMDSHMPEAEAKRLTAADHELKAQEEIIKHARSKIVIRHRPVFSIKDRAAGEKEE